MVGCFDKIRVMTISYTVLHVKFVWFVMLVDDVYVVLRWDIIRGMLRFNELLVEVDIVDRFDVSCTPVWESMQWLANEGLIVSWWWCWYVYEHIRVEVIEIY